MDQWRARNRLLGDFGAQSAANYLATGLRVVRGFAIAGLLGPSGMGVVATGNLLLNYSQYADLGITQGVGRELPVSLGSGEGQAAQRWIWYALVAKILGGCVVLLAIVAWLLSPLSVAAPVAVKWVLILSSAASLSSGVTLAWLTVLRGVGDFMGAAFTTAIMATLNLVFGLTGAYVAGPVGVAAGVLFASLGSCAYGWLRVKPLPSLSFRREEWTRLVRLGIPLALLTFIGFNMENLDQVMILALLDRTQLGLYSIVIQAGGLLTLTGLSVSNVVGPRLLRVYAQHKTLSSIESYTWKPALVLSSVMPVVICSAWLVGSGAIAFLLPAYFEALPAFRIYMAAMYFLTLNLGVSTTLLALGKHKLNVPIMIGCIGFNIVVDLLLVGALGFGIEGIALGSAATYVLYWVLHTGLVRWYFERTMGVVIRRNARLAVPGVALLCFLFLSYSTGQMHFSPLLDFVFLMLAMALCVVQIRPLIPELVSMVRDGYQK